MTVYIVKVATAMEVNPFVREIKQDMSALARILTLAQAMVIACHTIVPQDLRRIEIVGLKRTAMQTKASSSSLLLLV